MIWDVIYIDIYSRFWLDMKEEETNWAYKYQAFELKPISYLRPSVHPSKPHTDCGEEEREEQKGQEQADQKEQKEQELIIWMNSVPLMKLWPTDWLTDWPTGTLEMLAHLKTYFSKDGF